MEKRIFVVLSVWGCGLAGMEWNGFGETYALDDLEEDDAEEGVDLGCLLVGSCHLGFHPAREGTGCL
jgi:hypothetical protein